MSSKSQLTQFRRKVPVRRMPANSSNRPGVTLNEVLTFISHAPILSLRAIRTTLLLRRESLEYSVYFKNGVCEVWSVDSSDQLIDILLNVRREITHVTPGKEYIK